MSNKSFFISLIVLVATIASISVISRRGEPVVLSTNLENFPMEIAGYKATEDSFPESVYKELNADKHIYRHYQAQGGQQVDLYIGYYGTAKGGRTGHNPYACLPGSGWGIVEARKVKLKVNYYPDGIYVNHILAQKGGLYAIVLHWYQSAGNKVLSTGIQQNIQRFIGRVYHNRGDGAFVQISAIFAEDDLEEAESLVQSFAQQVLHVLPRYWPLEQ